MQTSRRRFLQSVAGSSTLLAMGASVPEFLGRSAWACQDESGAKAKTDNVLVVVQLSGGNDGLNTVVPYADDAYNRNRFVLRVGSDQVHKIDDHVGLHPQMDGFAELLEEAQLAVVQGVGYPNPNRSHFRSMDIWHAAAPDPDTRDGWLGRYLAETATADTGLTPALRLGVGKLPLALEARSVAVPSMESLQQFRLRALGDTEQQRRMRERIRKLAERGIGPDAQGTAEANALLPFIRRSALAAYTSSERIQAALQRDGGEGDYPGFDLARKLRMIGQLIDADLGTRIYYVELGGFDTHANQAGAHAALLNELSASVTAFLRDLSRRGHVQRVLVMTFSEFGRRVRENASRGTDHGAAAPMFLAGGRVKPGPHGAHPSLTDLDAGDLKHHTDFRRVYATILEYWLGCPAARVLGGDFEPLDGLVS